jgi:Ca2+-binding EF-hand superfamily protein
MSCTPVAVILLIIYQYCSGKVKAELTIRNLRKNEEKRNKVLTTCYAELFTLMDTDKSGYLGTTELIDLLRLVGYRDTNEHVISHPKALRLIRGICKDRYATEIPLGIFMKEIQSGHLQGQMTKYFQINEKVKKRKKKQSESMLHDGMAILTWNEQRKVVTTTFHVGMMILMLLHTPVSKKVFQYFDCDTIGAGEWGRSFLRVDYSIPCAEGTTLVAGYAMFLPFVLVVLLSFTLLLPTFLSVYMGIHRKKLYRPLVMLRIGWMYDRMSRGSEHWEIYEILRKMILTGLIVFFPRNPTVRACMCVLISTVATAGLNYHRPHKNYLVFWVDQICYLVALLMYVVAMVFGAGLDEKSKNTMGAVFVTLFVLLLLAFVATIVWTAMQVRRSDQVELFGGSLTEMMAEEDAVKATAFDASLDIGSHATRMMHTMKATQVVPAIYRQKNKQKFQHRAVAAQKKKKPVLSTLFDAGSFDASAFDVDSFDPNSLDPTEHAMSKHHSEIDDILGIAQKEEKLEHAAVIEAAAAAIEAATTATTATSAGKKSNNVEQAAAVDAEANAPEYFAIQSMLRKLSDEKFAKLLSKLSTHSDGTISPKRIKILLKRLRITNGNFVADFMLKKLSNDSGKTVSEEKFIAYARQSPDACDAVKELMHALRKNHRSTVL